jgi:hypothetical protein
MNSDDRNLPSEDKWRILSAFRQRMLARNLCISDLQKELENISRSPVLEDPPRPGHVEDLQQPFGLPEQDIKSGVGHLQFVWCLVRKTLRTYMPYVLHRWAPSPESWVHHPTNLYVSCSGLPHCLKWATDIRADENIQFIITLGSEQTLNPHERTLDPLKIKLEFGETPRLLELLHHQHVSAWDQCIGEWRFDTERPPMERIFICFVWIHHVLGVLLSGYAYDQLTQVVNESRSRELHRQQDENPEGVPWPYADAWPTSPAPPPLEMKFLGSHEDLSTFHFPPWSPEDRHFQDLYEELFMRSPRYDHKHLVEVYSFVSELLASIKEWIKRGGVLGDREDPLAKTLKIRVSRRGLLHLDAQAIGWPYDAGDLEFLLKSERIYVTFRGNRGAGYSSRFYDQLMKKFLRSTNSSQGIFNHWSLILLSQKKIKSLRGSR